MSCDRFESELSQNTRSEPSSESLSHTLAPGDTTSVVSNVRAAV